MSDQDRRIVVEIFSHQEADRLRSEMQQMEVLLRSEIDSLNHRLEGLHRTLYETLEAISKLRSKR